MHVSAFDFVASCAQRYKTAFCFKNVLEVGSQDLNGSIRPLFIGCDYLGLDLMPGEGVDVVGHLYDQDFKFESFDTIVSLEAMEHDSRWVQSVERMVRLLKPKGCLVITCATTGREEHGTFKSDPSASPATNDYYRNVEAYEFIECVDLNRFSEFRFEVDESCGDLRFFGIKKS